MNDYDYAHDGSSAVLPFYGVRLLQQTD